MADETGVNGSTFDRTSEWGDFIKNSTFTKLIYDNLGTNRYKVYRYGSELYYLTDENNNYLGHIELENNRINSSFSKLKGGFYNIMFTIILTQIQYIISDKSLSTQAIRSYEKLNQLPAKKYKMYVISNNNISNTKPFSKEELLSNSSNRVMITEKSQNYMLESIKDYYTRINKYDKLSGYPLSLTKYYNEKNEICDLYLFNEYISLMNEGYLDLNTEKILLDYIKDKIPTNKHMIIKGTSKSIGVGYITDYDENIFFDVSDILDISTSKNDFIKYFDKIPLNERDYIIMWRDHIII